MIPMYMELSMDRTFVHIINRRSNCMVRMVQYGTIWFVWYDMVRMVRYDMYYVIASESARALTTQAQLYYGIASAEHASDLRDRLSDFRVSLTSRDVN